MASAQCAKCGSSSGNFSTTTKPTSYGTAVLIYCNNCGAVQGAFRQED